VRSLYFSQLLISPSFCFHLNSFFLFLYSQNFATASVVLAHSLSLSQTSVLTKVSAAIATTSSVEVRLKLCLLVSVFPF